MEAVEAKKFSVNVEFEVLAENQLDAETWFQSNVITTNVMDDPRFIGVIVEDPYYTVPLSECKHGDYKGMAHLPDYVCELCDAHIPFDVDPHSVSFEPWEG
jgi:hypothetical protein